MPAGKGANIIFSKKEEKGESRELKATHSCINTWEAFKANYKNIDGKQCSICQNQFVKDKTCQIIAHFF